MSAKKNYCARARIRNARWLFGLLALVGVFGNTPTPAQTMPPRAAPAAVAVSTNAFLNSLTVSERAWLSAHPVIRVAQDTSWPPIEFTDQRGALSGMTADYLTLIEQRLGLKFERVPNLSWQEAYDRMQRWEIDMTTAVAVTREREAFWAFTKPYMTMPIVIVTRADVPYIGELRELVGGKVAVVDGYVANTWITQDFPEIQLVRVKTTEEALRMLQRGEVFACVENMLVVGHYLAELKITNLKVAGRTPYNNAQCMAVRKDWAILAGILDKALDSISQSERNAIYRTWLPIQYEYGFAYSQFLPVAAIVAVFLLGLAAWKWKQVAVGRGVTAGGGWLKPWQAHLFAISATAATFGLRIALDGQLGGEPSLVIFTLPIMLSAYLGGLRAGLLATVLTFFGASYYLLSPIHSFSVDSGVERWQQFFVALAGVFVSGLSEVLHRARRRADIASREHQEAEERVQAALNETHDLRAALDEHAIVAITNAQGKITFVNDKFCAISQYSRAELIGKDHRLINSGFHSKEFMRELWTTIAQGKAWHGEVKNRAKDGSFYWVATTIVPFLDDSGKPRQYIAIRADITERKKAESALQESEERFRTMANSMYQLAWIAKADGFIFWYNQRWYDYTGTTPEQMAGWGWQCVHDPSVLPKVMENWRGAIATVQPFEMEFPLRGVDGRYRTFLTRAVPLKDSAGQVEQWFGTNTDVEAMKRAEEEIRQLNASLEQRVTERTAQLEAANRELEAFSYSVSHDLRAPLRAIDGFSRILLEDNAGQLNAEGVNNLNRVCAATRRMGQLIDDLLQLSRLTRSEVRRSTVDLSALARNVADELQQADQNRRMEFVIEPDLIATADANLMRVVLANLLGNAWKFTGKRSDAKIEFGVMEKWSDGVVPSTPSSTAPTLPHSSTPVFFVRDNGAGFDMAYAGKLFGAFQRLHTTDEFPGNGVGLATLQRILHRHNGRVWAEGKTNGGATFYFTLPAPLERASL